MPTTSSIVRKNLDDVSDGSSYYKVISDYIDANTHKIQKIYKALSSFQDIDGDEVIDTINTNDLTSTGVIRAGTDGGARVEMNLSGIDGYNTSNENTFYLDSSTGDMHLGTAGGARLSWTSSSGSLEIKDADEEVFFKVSGSEAIIGGWYFDNSTGLLKSAATNNLSRLELNPVKNKISVFDGSEEKVVMGYLDGLIRNNATGTASSGSTTTLTDSSKDWKVNELSDAGLVLHITAGTNSGESRTIVSNTKNTITTTAFTSAIDSTSVYEVRYTSSNYGFWALQGDHLSIDGDMVYDSGDWLIQHDGSLKIFDGSGDEIVRLGSDIQRKGLFIYDQYHNVISQIHRDGLEVGSAALSENSVNSVNSTLWHFEDSLVASDGSSASSEVSVVYTNSGKFSKGIFVEDGTTNHFSDRLDFQTNWNAYSGAVETITSGQSDPDGGTSAYRIQTSGGTSIVKYYTGFETGETDYHYSQSVWIKNTGTTDLIVGNNTTEGEHNQTVTGNSSEWVRVELANNTSTGTVQIQFRTSVVGDDLDFIAYHPQMEKLADADGICTVTSFTDSTRDSSLANLSSSKATADEGTIAFYWNPVTSNNRKYPNYISYAGMDIIRQSENSIKFYLESGGNFGFDLTLSLSEFTFEDNKQYFMVFRWNQFLKKSNITIYNEAGIKEAITDYTWPDTISGNVNCAFFGNSNSIIDELLMTNYYADDALVQNWFDAQSIYSMTGRTLVDAYGFRAYNPYGSKTVDIEGSTGDASFTGDIVANSFEVAGPITGSNILDVSYVNTEKDIVFHFDENVLSTRGDAPISFNANNYQINAKQGMFGGGVVLAEPSKNIIGTSSWGGYSNRDGIEFRASTNRWVAYGGATVEVAEEKEIEDPFGNHDAYRIKTTGGTSEDKYYIDAGVSTSGISYSYSIWVKNIGTKDMVVYYNLGAHTSTVTAGGDWTLIYDEANAGDDTTHNKIQFKTTSGNSGDALEFLAFEPQIEENEDCTAFMEDERTVNSSIAYNKNLIAGKKKATIGFWYNVLLNRPSTSSTSRIFSLETSDNDRIYLQYRSSYLRCYVYNAGTQIAYIRATDYSGHAGDEPVFVTVSWDTEAGILRVRTYKKDGTLLSNDIEDAWTDSWPEFAGTGDFYLGSKDGSGYTVNGLVDELVIFGDEYKSDDWLDQYAYHAKPFYDSNEDIIRAGGRVRMDSSGLVGYDSVGVKTFEIGTATGDAYFSGDIDAKSGKFSGNLDAEKRISGGSFTNGYFSTGFHAVIVDNRDMDTIKSSGYFDIDNTYGFEINQDDGYTWGYFNDITSDWNNVIYRSYRAKVTSINESLGRLYHDGHLYFYSGSSDSWEEATSGLVGVYVEGWVVGMGYDSPTGDEPTPARTVLNRGDSASGGLAILDDKGRFILSVYDSKILIPDGEISGATVTGGKMRTANETVITNKAIVLDGSNNTFKMFKANRSDPFDSNDYSILIDDNAYQMFDGTLIPAIAMKDGAFTITDTDNSNAIYITSDYIYIHRLERRDMLSSVIGGESSVEDDGSGDTLYGGIFSNYTAGGSNGSTKVGCLGKSTVTGNTSTDTVIGIWGKATTNGSGVAWAGYFDEGNVKVVNNLTVNSEYQMNEISIIDSSRNTNFNNINADGTYQMGGSTIIDSSGYQTGAMRTRSLLHFSHDGPINSGTTVDLSTSQDSIGAGVITIPKVARITDIGLNCASVECTDTGDEIRVLVYYALPGSTSWTQITGSPVTVFTSTNDTNYSVSVSGLTLDISAGWRIKVAVEAYEYTLHSDITDPQCTISLLTE